MNKFMGKTYKVWINLIDRGKGIVSWGYDSREAAMKAEYPHAKVLVRGYEVEVPYSEIRTEYFG